MFRSMRFDRPSSVENRKSFSQKLDKNGLRFYSVDGLEPFVELLKYMLYRTLLTNGKKIIQAGQLFTACAVPVLNECPLPLGVDIYNWTER